VGEGAGQVHATSLIGRTALVLMERDAGLTMLVPGVVVSIPSQGSWGHMEGDGPVKFWMAALRSTVVMLYQLTHRLNMSR